MQDVANASEVDLGGGLVYKDIRQGGGQSVQQGFLTVLHYRQFHPARSLHAESILNLQIQQKPTLPSSMQLRLLFSRLRCNVHL